MKGPIKSVLAEELQNSIRMKNEYKNALEKMPKGCLRKRNIKGHDYYYVVKRENGKIVEEYKGKLSKGQIAEIENNVQLRAKYRELLSQANKQIKFLKGCLRGKEPV
jgi:hypothetical protein